MVTSTQSLADPKLSDPSETMASPSDLVSRVNGDEQRVRQERPDTLDWRRKSNTIGFVPGKQAIVESLLKIYSASFH